ncbi:hypothetical protein [Mameliella alba]|uniref:Uncharacterized protein n=1 Tax=Mameliella alba TaxID=561184 RepID=A0A0B3RG22_9RHOB|nr:hypothetical protein [Mameliella alba]KHQ50185.1 hypothetical protein OA50_05305 [Mameliella alba]OWV39206.1 hypothetical protein CDZ95_27195 [Mameliella alba]
MIRSVPLIFNDPAYHDPADVEHLCLPYTVAPCANSQRRFAGRLYAVPRVALCEYEFRAVFDWIEISIETRREHAGVNLQRRLMKLNRDFGAFRTCFVESPTRGKAHSGRGHVIKMQDPAPGGLPGLLRAFLREDCAPGCTLDKIPVTGVELSLDVYPAPRFCEGDYAVRRMLMTELLRKHVAVAEVFREDRRHPRFVYKVYKTGSNTTTQRLVDPGSTASYCRTTARELGLRHFDIASCDSAHHHQPVLDSTLYFGKKGERLYYRLMDKITDNRKGDMADDLPCHRTRSRAEFTFIDETPGDGLGPASVGISSINDLALDGLTSFNTLLGFELPTFRRDGSDPEAPDRNAWEIFAKTGVAGLAQREDVLDVMEGDRDALRARARQRVQSSGKRLRFSDLNMRATKALRRLEERWQRDWR